MAPFGEVVSMLYGQAFGRPCLPDIDLSAKTIIITGSNTGLGLECAKHLAKKKAAHIILACRTVEKGEAAKEKIMAETRCTDRTRLEVWSLDLSDYDSVLSFVSRARTELDRLDAVIANAGMELQEYRTAEDLEIHLTVNVVATFLCAIGLLPKLRETAREHDADTNLVFCGSMYHIFGPDAEFDRGLSEDVDMFEELSSPNKDKTDIIWRYALSKLMVHQSYHGLCEHLRTIQSHDYSRVNINLVNPGWCGTELSRAKPHPMGERICFALMGWTAEKGSRVYVDALAKGKSTHGRYLSECSIKEESGYVYSARGRRIQEKMWKDLMRRIEKIEPEVAGFIQ